MEYSWIYLNSISSTQKFAYHYAKTLDLPARIGILANMQTLGIGQRNNIWYSNNTENLYISFVIIDYNTQFLHNFISFAAFLAIYRALNEMNSRIIVECKYPNDIILNSCKIGGVLTQSILAHNLDVNHDGMNKYIIGIGINLGELQKDERNSISPKSLHYKENLDQVAHNKFHKLAPSSIFNEMNIVLNPKNLASKIALYLEDIIFTFSNFKVIENINSYLYGKNRKICFQDNGKIFSGIMKTIQKDGALLVAMGNQMESFYNPIDLRFDR